MNFTHPELMKSAMVVKIIQLLSPLLLILLAAIIPGSLLPYTLSLNPTNCGPQIEDGALNPSEMGFPPRPPGPKSNQQAEQAASSCC